MCYDNGLPFPVLPAPQARNPASSTQVLHIGGLGFRGSEYVVLLLPNNRPYEGPYALMLMTSLKKSNIPIPNSDYDSLAATVFSMYRGS